MTHADAFVHEALRWVGTREEGFNRGASIIEFQKAMDGKAAGEPWCMSFIHFCLKQIRVESSLFPSEHVLTVWNNTEKMYRRAMPLKGSVAIWKMKGTICGHASIVVQISSRSTMRCVEGNTGPGKVANTVVREGDGVYLKNRPIGDAGNMLLVGFLWPFKVKSDGPNARKIT